MSMHLNRNLVGYAVAGACACVGAHALHARSQQWQRRPLPYSLVCKYAFPGLVIAPCTIWFHGRSLLLTGVVTNRAAFDATLCAFLGHLFVDGMWHCNDLPLVIHHVGSMVVGGLIVGGRASPMLAGDPLACSAQVRATFEAAVAHILTSDVYPLLYAVHKHYIPSTTEWKCFRRVCAMGILHLVGSYRIPITACALRHCWSNVTVRAIGCTQLALDVFWFGCMVAEYGGDPTGPGRSRTITMAKETQRPSSPWKVPLARCRIGVACLMAIGFLIPFGYAQ